MPVEKRQLDRVIDLLQNRENTALNEAAGDLVDAARVYCEVGGYETEKALHDARAKLGAELRMLGVSEKDAPNLTKNFLEAIYAGKADWDEREGGKMKLRSSSEGARTL